MPPSTRRSAQKRSADTRLHSDPDGPDSSPSHPAAKKRKVGAAAQPSRSVPRTILKKPNSSTRRRPPPSPPFEDDPGDDDDAADDTSSDAELQDIADKVIPHLAVAKAQVAVANDHSNSQHAEDSGGKVQAFAKVCGRNWTYYVKELVVVIGRPPDPISRHSSGPPGESSPTPHSAHDESPTVHIDLGPSKTISRLHAELFYDMEDGKWHISVVGRNGLKLNTANLHRGEDFVIRCGDVLEIAGTQMMFVTANDKANIHHSFLEKLDDPAAQDEKDQGSNQSHAHPDILYPTAPVSSESQFGRSSQTNGQTMIAPAPPNYARPTTPLSPPKKTPHASSGVKQSPAYGRGIMLESTERIDYRDDATKDLKPTIPYSVMITQAILSTPEEMLTLSGIYDWIKSNFSYYRHLTTNWQNSIRHNLSLNSAFGRRPRRSDEPGKGMKWVILPDRREEMISHVAKHMKKSVARHSSAPNSPVAKDAAIQIPYAPAAASQHYSSEVNGTLKTSPPRNSPPLSSYPTARESYTPSRGSHITAGAYGDSTQNLPSLDEPSPLPVRRINPRFGKAADSSPILGTGFAEGFLVTPAPRQHNLNRLHPNTSTIALPTADMPNSSPAPFWKFEDDGAPGEWPEVSPLKVSNPQSSSPPPAVLNGIESPTRGRGSGLANVVRVDDEDDEKEIDIARGFQGISSYHQQRNTATAGHVAS